MRPTRVDLGKRQTVWRKSQPLYQHGKQLIFWKWLQRVFKSVGCILSMGSHFIISCWTVFCDWPLRRMESLYYRGNKEQSLTKGLHTKRNTEMQGCEMYGFESVKEREERKIKGWGVWEWRQTEGTEGKGIREGETDEETERGETERSL